MKLCNISQGLVWDSVWLSVGVSVWDSVWSLVWDSVFGSINDEDYIVARTKMNVLLLSSLEISMKDKINENDDLA